MSKENPEEVKKVITEKQRARISQNFKAAKALLARKRPHDSLYVTPFKDPNSFKRVPLSEIPVNRYNAILESGTELFDGESNRVSLKLEAISTRIESCNSVIASFDSFTTPIKQSLCAGLTVNFSTPSILDDDELDESVFEEIDAICAQCSSVKADDKSAGSILLVDTDVCEENIGDCSSLKSDSVNGNVEAKDSSQMMLLRNMPEEYSKYLLGLNDRQREAACTDISIPLMIVAGPGSGKTSTMVGRILMLLSEGVSPSNILAMTFTTAAASEMRDRIGSVAGKAVAKEITISTFHSFSLQLCRSHADKLERTSEFLIYGNGQQRRAVIEAVRLLEKEKSGPENHHASKLAQDLAGNKAPECFKNESKKWQKYVTRAKASGKPPAECLKMGNEIGAAILENYNSILRSCNALDYHDLISCSVKLLTDFPEVYKECQDSWRSIVIDEFQDTSTMQYSLLRVLASHNHVTIVGDDDQSIFSFNGADTSGFDSFRRDFPNYKEVRLNKNYRSTRYIVEAASSVIRNNVKRCRLKDVLTDNSYGSKIVIKECQNEHAQCAFVIDKILETVSNDVPAKPYYGSIAILYRRQISGKVFQSSFRERKIPFNVHGVAFYRKKVVKAIIAMLRTTLIGCDDGPYRQVFKALLPFEKEEKKRVIDHIDKISTIRKCSFFSAACDIFTAKISGTFKRSQLTQGRKVLSTLDMISKLVQREQSISAIITSVANLVPQKYLLEQRAVVDADGGKLLNEDNDLRSVLQYLLDDVSDFFSMQSSTNERETDDVKEDKGCTNLLKSFIDYIAEREKENFRSRRHDNENSVTLTTIHQSKGLEWDIVFIIKANESEIPLLHESSGFVKENRTSIEEERRLFYVAMTRARKKLFILYVAMDSNWQMLQPSRFLKEIPDPLREIQAEVCVQDLHINGQNLPIETIECNNDSCEKEQSSEIDRKPNDFLQIQANEALKESEHMDPYNGNTFLRRFAVEERTVVSHLFHQWAKKQAFQNPKRLVDKVGFVIDERLRVKKNKHRKASLKENSLVSNLENPKNKQLMFYDLNFQTLEAGVDSSINEDVLRELKSCLGCDEAFQYAEYVLRWEQIPADQRAHIMQEKQEHFQKLRIENSMSSSEPTAKQIKFLQNLGCTVSPTSRLHASRLIEQYKSL